MAARVAEVGDLWSDMKERRLSLGPPLDRLHQLHSP
jgi:hypothetical protein